MRNRLSLSALAEMHPGVAIVLGSGLGEIARRLSEPRSVPFSEVPGLAVPPALGHSGCLAVGKWAGQSVLVFQGRLHYYEGYSWRRVTVPVEVAGAFGVRMVLLTNAAGGIHDTLAPGSFMAVRDHIEWTRPYCWRQPGPGGLGRPRIAPYADRLLNILKSAARKTGVALHEGVYAAVTGPNYETPAEVRALRAWGADAVGMSTTREAQAAFELGLECAAVSCITNRAAGLCEVHIDPDQVVTTAGSRCEALADLIEAFLRSL
jgi:purine-nucleoside phosphorylase